MSSPHYCACGQHFDPDEADLELEEGHDYSGVERRRRSNSLPSWAHPLPARRSGGHFLRASERRVSFVDVEVELASSEEAAIVSWTLSITVDKVKLHPTH